MTSSLKGKKIGISSLLQKKIKKLSSDTAFESFPPYDGREDLEMIERQKAERYFQHALCRRIWWRLSPQERGDINTLIIKKEPLYKDHLRSDFIESDCMKEIHDILSDSV